MVGREDRGNQVGRTRTSLGADFSRLGRMQRFDQKIASRDTPSKVVYTTKRTNADNDGLRVDMVVTFYFDMWKRMG